LETFLQETTIFTLQTFLTRLVVIINEITLKSKKVKNL